MVKEVMVSYANSLSNDPIMVGRNNPCPLTNNILIFIENYNIYHSCILRNAKKAKFRI